MKYLRRLVWYLSSRLLILFCVLGLMTMAFYFSMNATNIYIILKDGMAKRAQVVMMGEDENLNAYFSPAYLERDALLIEARSGKSSYQNYYTIKGFDHRINLDSFWCWPWEDTARATITEAHRKAHEEPRNSLLRFTDEGLERDNRRKSEARQAAEKVRRQKRRRSRRQKQKMLADKRAHSEIKAVRRMRFDEE